MIWILWTILAVMSLYYAGTRWGSEYAWSLFCALLVICLMHFNII